MSGVRTIDDLRDRCRIDDETGGRIWGGARSSAGICTLWLPAIGRTASLGVAVCVLKTGKEPRRGVVWHSICGRSDCANPDHRKRGDRSSQMLAYGIERTPVQCAHIAAGKRAVSKLSDAAAEDIRGSSEPLRVLAERHGISISHAGNVRRGKQRRPLAAPGSSVFSMGAA